MLPKVTKAEASLLAKDICPDCGSPGLINEACRVASVNVTCSNIKCRARFNIPVPFTPERICYGFMKQDTVKFTCWKCSAKLETSNHYIGKKGKCPKCRSKNTIPSMHDTLEDSIIIMFNDMDENEEKENENEENEENRKSEFEQYDSESYKDDDGGNLPNG